MVAQGTPSPDLGEQVHAHCLPQQGVLKMNCLNHHAWAPANPKLHPTQQNQAGHVCTHANGQLYSPLEQNQGLAKQLKVNL